GAVGALLPRFLADDGPRRAARAGGTDSREPLSESLDHGPGAGDRPGPAQRRPAPASLLGAVLGGAGHRREQAGGTSHDPARGGAEELEGRACPAPVEGPRRRPASRLPPPRQRPTLTRGPTARPGAGKEREHGSDGQALGRPVGLSGPQFLGLLAVGGDPPEP